MPCTAVLVPAFASLRSAAAVLVRAASALVRAASALVLAPAAWRRVASVLVLAFAVLLVAAPPASAHTGGSAPSNWLSEITSVTPAPPGVTLRLIAAGDRLELSNSSSRTIIVQGYDGEPYLRITSTAVEQNLRSAATYINATRDGRTPIPPTVDPRAEPSWQRVADQPRYTWHDHRTHWMGDTLPAAVRAAPGQPHLIAQWELPLTYGGTPVTVAGTLRWVPAPSPWPWLAVIAALVAAAWIAAGLPSWRRVLPPLLATLAVADLAHLALSGAAIVSDLAPGVFGAALAALAAVGAARARPWSPYAAALAAAVVGTVAGLSDVSWLTHSQLPFAGPTWLARLCVAAALGLGAGLALAGWRIWRREQPLPAPPPPALAHP
jgi:hypothetical protein